MLAAADEVDDFVAVAGGDLRIAPALARKNFEIAFDGDAAILESEFPQKIDYRCARCSRARFPIYINRGFHVRHFSHSTCRRGFRFCAELKAQLAARIPSGDIDHERRIFARESRQIKFETRVAVGARLSGDFSRLRGANKPRNHESVGGRSSTVFVAGDNVQRGVFAGKPGAGVQHFNGEDSFGGRRDRSRSRSS